MKVEIYNILKTTAGGFHYWCESNVGIIRKPTNYFKPIEKTEKPIIKLRWYQIIWLFIKRLWLKVIGLKD